MRMLALIGLALPGMALAQTVGSADRWEGTPQVSLKTAQTATPSPSPTPRPVPAPRTTPAVAPTPAPGINWQPRPVSPPAAPPVVAETRPAPPPAAPRPAPAASAQARPPAPAAPGVSWQNRPVDVDPPAVGPTRSVRAQRVPLPTRPAEIRRSIQSRPVIQPAPPEVEEMLAPEYEAPPVDDLRAIRAGDQVTGAWDHPAYMLDPVELGLAPPPPGARWISYVDGALLVDAGGRVLDTRWDLPEPVAPEWAEEGEWGPGPAGYGAPAMPYAPGPPASITVTTITTTRRGR
jgi:hypothetical protein